jgi:RNA polymerase sigma-70 factor (ECF subfamily)
MRHAPSPHAPADALPTFDQVYADGFPFVFRVLRSLGVHPHRLEDAAQDVFTVVHRRLAEFEGRSSIRTWLFGIAQRVASDYRRGERRKASQLDPLTPDIQSEHASPHANLEARRAADFVDEFLKSLSSQKREVFALAFMEEMPAGEVAQALGIPLNTAYSRIRTVRAELKKALERRKLR